MSNNNNNKSSSCMQDVDCSHQHLPDACGNDERQEKLLDRQETGALWDRERNLLIACLVLVLLMNISTGRYVLYPFKIFSTWVHEMCHGLAAIFTGGYIAKLQIFQNGSGLAYTASPHGTVVSSAGYPGTAVTGCLLLLFRRTTLGPTVCTMGLGAALLLSCALYVRNEFGLIVLPIEGVVLLLCGWKLPAVLLDNLFNFLAVTVSLNAFENIQDLYGSEEGMAGGEVRSTDAHTVSESWGGDYRMWASIWLTMSIVLTIVGILGARDARALPWSQVTTSSTTASLFNNNATTATTTTTPVVKYGNATTTSSDNNNRSVWNKLKLGGTPNWRSPSAAPAPIQPGYVAHVV